MVDSDSKRLELALEAVPHLKRLGVVMETYPEAESQPQIVAARSAFDTLARTHKIAVQEYRVKSFEDIQSTIKKVAGDRIQLVILLSSYLTIQHREPIITGLGVHNIPVITAGRDMAETGALLTYSPDFFDLWKRSAVYVDKILKGAKPADLPIQQPTKFELIVNLKAAKALGLAIPESILLRADRVIQ
jgi:ABC-type uncharacterized transport system substrate-binding protein